VFVNGDGAVNTKEKEKEGRGRKEKGEGEEKRNKEYRIKDISEDMSNLAARFFPAIACHKTILSKINSSSVLCCVERLHMFTYQKYLRVQTVEAILGGCAFLFIRQIPTMHLWITQHHHFNDSLFDMVTGYGFWGTVYGLVSLSILRSKVW
jgi:hypothetical protein